MNNQGGEAAEQIVRMSLEGTQVVAKITGRAAERVAILLTAALRGQKKTRGKTRLNSLLRSGKELKVFTVRDQELEKFCYEAKKYGVLYCVLKDKKDTDKYTDIIVRAEDAAKINRIFERFGIATTEVAQARSEIVKAKEQMEQAKKQEQQESPIQAEKSGDEIEEFLDAGLGNTAGPKAKEKEHPPEGSQKSPSLSEPYSKDSKSRGHTDLRDTRPSVRQELKALQAVQNGKAKSRTDPQKIINKVKKGKGR